jgi:RimJ/RimL family protein N-acetyltransferase
MLLYPPGELAAAREAVDALSFQRQTNRDPFPEERPMRVGSVEHEGQRFLLHVHIIAADAPEARELLRFRDQLRANAGLRQRYLACKRAILDAGVIDRVDYCYRKGEFIETVLKSLPRPAYPEQVETARMVLTRPVAADLNDLDAMHSDGRVMATLGGLRTREELDASNRRLSACWEDDGFGWWIARYRADGRFVGRGGVRRIEIAGWPQVELGYGLVVDFWRQGLATELALASVATGFEVLGLEDIICFTLTTNDASQGVMKKVGFRHEWDGEHAGLPHVFYRLRRRDWEASASSVNEPSV